MKKIFTIICLLALIIPTTFKAEETLGDIQNELADLEQEYDKKEEELANGQVEYDKLYEELTTVANEKTKTENSIQTTKNSILAKQEQITDLEKNQIPQMEKKAKISLEFSQQNYNQNILLSIVYNSLQNEKTSILETIQATTILFSELNSSLFDLLTLLNQVEEDKADLEIQQEQLSAKEEELKTQESYLENLKAELSAQINEMESDLASQEDIIASQKEKERLYEEAGCAADDVYGVDCAQNEMPEASGTFNRPTTHGVITNEFGGYSTGNYSHSGIDVANSAGTPIYPTANGKVLYAGDENMSVTGTYGGGNNVIVLHVVNGQNYVSRYCHMSSISVSTGQTVTTSTQLGSMGATGNVTGVHLHFEIQQGSSYNWSTLVNPRTYVSFPAIGVWW